MTHTPAPETTPFWITAFLDLPANGFERAVEFWAQVTECTIEPSEKYPEYTSLIPPEGDVILRLQRIDRGAPAFHLDVHVPDVRATADRVVSLGGTERTAPAGANWVVVASPGGLPLCVVPDARSHRPDPVSHDDTAWLPDQVCVDAPPALHDAEVDFWSALTGWAVERSSVAGEFTPLTRPQRHPYRLMVQQVENDRARVEAHLDLASIDRAGAVARHVALGASVQTATRHFTVMRDPGQGVYCITDRDPATGLLPG